MNQLDCLIEGLQILRKYEPESQISCDDGALCSSFLILYGLGLDIEDGTRLKELGWEISQGHYYQFYCGTLFTRVLEKPNTELLLCDYCCKHFAVTKVVKSPDAQLREKLTNNDKFFVCGDCCDKDT